MKWTHHRPENPPWLLWDWQMRTHAYRAYDKENSVYEPFLKEAEELRASLLVCSGSIRIHTDSFDLPKFAYFAVIRNDGYVAKMHRPHYLPATQLPGDIVRLDIHEDHHLVRDTRLTRYPTEYGVWAALVFNLDKEITQAEALEKFIVATANYVFAKNLKPVANEM